MRSGLARTLEWYRKRDYLVDVTERFNPHVGEYGARFDWCGIADLVAVPPLASERQRKLRRDVLQVEFVQATSGTNVSHHLRAYEEDEVLLARIVSLIDAGHLFLVFGWRKLKGHGRRQWFPRVVWAEVVDSLIVWRDWDGVSDEAPWRSRQENA